MLGAIKDLLNSEKAVASGIVSITSTVLTAIGAMTIDQWIDFNKWVLTVYVAGKTITSGVAMATNRKAETKTTIEAEIKTDAEPK